MVKLATKKRLNARKKNSTCIAVAARKGTIPTNCRIPSRITCNAIISGTYPWYIRTPEKKEGHKGKKQKGKRRKKRKKNETKTNKRSGRRPSPEGIRLLFTGTISPRIFPVDGPIEGRHNNTRRKTRKEKKRAETELKKAIISVSICMSSW